MERSGQDLIRVDARDGIDVIDGDGEVLLRAPQDDDHLSPAPAHVPQQTVEALEQVLQLEAPGALEQAPRSRRVSPAGELASLQPAGGAGALGPGLSLVAVTEFGNLAATPRGDEPLLDAERIAAGAEFLLRAHSGPLADWALDVPVCCRAHRIHGAVVSAAQAAATPPGAVDVAAGGTAFYAPDGRRLVCAADGLEQCVVLAVPLAAQRAGSAAGAASGEGV